MPRLPQGRAIGAEEALVRRIKRERELRGWSFESLAKRMTDVGCPIPASAVFKIENSTPPRAVRIDELVALSIVFEIPLDALLVDPETRVSSEAMRCVQRLWSMSQQRQEALQARQEAAKKVTLAAKELLKIADELLRDSDAEELDAIRQYHLLPNDLPDDVRNRLGIEASTTDSAL